MSPKGLSLVLFFSRYTRHGDTDGLNRLKVNPTKTEFLLIGTHQQRAKITNSSISFLGIPIFPSSQLRSRIPFKILQNKQLSYLHDLLHVHTPIRNLRSSNANLLVVSNISSNIGRRSFSYAAPTVWNSLPLSIRYTKSLSTFRSLLKTHLFPP